MSMDASASEQREDAVSATANDTDTAAAFYYDNALYSSPGIGDEVIDFPCNDPSDRLSGDHGAAATDNIDVPKADVIVEQEHHTSLAGDAACSQGHAEDIHTGEEQHASSSGSGCCNSEQEEGPTSVLRCYYTPWLAACLLVQEKK